MTDPAVGDLPFIDRHTLPLEDLSPDVVWAALDAHARSLGFGPRNPLAAVLGTRPRAGFEVTEVERGRALTLTGRHRFSRYALRFEVEPGAAGGTLLSALSFGAFPGVHGRAYRLAVVGSRGHVLATRHLLHAIARRARARGDR